jgi:hypothetical protein
VAERIGFHQGGSRSTLNVMADARPICFLVLTVFAVFLGALGCGHHVDSEYGLPITLGSSSNDIRRALGAPDHSYPDQQDARFIWESYNAHGIVAVFERDRLSSILLTPDVPGDSAKGFLQYSGTIVHGVRVADTKLEILQKLGKPRKQKPRLSMLGLTQTCQRSGPRKADIIGNSETTRLRSIF